MPPRRLIGCRALISGLAACALGAGFDSVIVDDAVEARQPQLAVDGSNRVFLAYGAGSSIRFRLSTDGGQSFAPAVTVGHVPVMSLGMRRGPRIAVTNEAIVVAVVGGERGMGRDGDVLVWRSTDLGQSWRGPTRLNAVEGSAREGLHALAAGPKNTVFCVWLDLRNQRTELCGTRSTDGGATWEPDRLVYRAPEKNICECCHPSLAIAPDGAIVALWRNSVAGARDIYWSRSTDGGASFEPAQKLGNKTWIVGGCPMDGGSFGIGPKGELISAWMRADAVYLAAAGKPEQFLARGVQPSIAIGPSGTYTVWLTRRPGRLQLAAPGAHEPRTLAETAIDPVVAAAPDGLGPVVAAWETRPGGGVIAATVLAPRSESPQPQP